MANLATSVVNWERLLSLRALQTEDEPDVVRRVIDLFVQDTPNRLARLHAAIADSQNPAIAREAHGIRGAAGMIGADDVFRAARALEDAANGQTPADLAGLAAVLERALAAVENELLRNR